MAAWILSMVDDTALVFASIAVYVWGMRTMHTLHHLSDPAMGVEFFRELMRAISVLTSVPGTPRKRIEHDVIEALLLDIYGNHWDDRVEVQFGLVVLILYFTFSRTECPCPKTFTGQDRRVTSSGRAYSIFFAPDGRRFDSLVGCWRYATAPSAPEGAASDVPAVISVSEVPAVVAVSPPSRSRLQPRQRRLCGQAAADGAAVCSLSLCHLSLHSFELDVAPRRA